MTQPPTASPAEPTLPRCMNCQQPLTGRYCAACGQDNRHGRLSLRQMLADGVDTVLSWELPLLRTVKDMLRNPGQVAAAYVAGQRRVYSNPLKFCFVFGALAVLVVQLMAMMQAENAAPGDDAEGTAREVNEYMRAINIWLQSWFHIVYFCSLPVLAFMLRVAFWRGGRTFIESLVLCLFVYGQVFLLQTPFVVLTHVVHPWFAYPSSLLGLAFMSWASATFYRGNRWFIAVTAVVIHLVHAVLLMAVVLTIGLVIMFAVYGRPG